MTRVKISMLYAFWLKREKKKEKKKKKKNKQNTTISAAMLLVRSNLIWVFSSLSGFSVEMFMGNTVITVMRKFIFFSLFSLQLHLQDSQEENQVNTYIYKKKFL